MAEELGMRGGRRRRGASGWTAGLLALSVAALGCGNGPTEPPDNGTPSPAISLSLAPGELRVLDESDQVRAFELQGNEAGHEYVVAVQSASPTPGAVTPMRLRVRAGEGASSSLRAAPSVRERPSDFSIEVRSMLGESRLKENMRHELGRVGAVPLGPHGREAPLRDRTDPQLSASLASTARQVPQTGDTLQFIMAVQPDLSVSCTDTDNVITAVVRDVGSGFALVEDTAVAGNFTAQDYQELNQELDDLVYPVNTAYWGTPADIDGNERVVVLFTAEVNKLTEEGELTFIAGFFWPGDLASKQECPASNAGEVLYLLAPDPGGDFGNEVSREFAKRNARGVTAHEFQHLLTAQQRVTKGGGTFNDLEDTWLSEGYAHIAEEVAGLKAMGLSLRANLGLSEAAADVTRFNAFLLSNFVRLAQFYLSPSATPAVAAEDPGGFESLRMRGFGWIMTRWLADQYAPAGPAGELAGAGEEPLFLELSEGQPGSPQGRGTANIERALLAATGQSVSWQQLLAEFSSMPPLTDTGLPALPAESQILTWNLRDMFQGLNESNLGQGQDCSPFCQAYPLLTTEVLLDGATDASSTFDLHPSAQRYFILRSDGPAPDVVVELSTPTGGTLPQGAQAQITVVRSQ